MSVCMCVFMCEKENENLGNKYIIGKKELLLKDNLFTFCW